MVNIYTFQPMTKSLNHIIEKLESNNKKKLNTYSLINIDDIDESFQDDIIGFET